MVNDKKKPRVDNLHEQKDRPSKQHGGKNTLHTKKRKKAIESVLQAEQYADDWVNETIEKENTNNRFVLGRVVTKTKQGRLIVTDGTDQQSVSLGKNMKYIDNPELVKNVLRAIKPSWYVPFRKKTSQKNGKQYYQFDNNFLEMIDHFSTLQKPVGGSERRYKMNAEWHNGFVFGFDAQKHPIVYTAEHGLTVVKNIKQDIQPKCGQYVDICIKLSKRTNKELVHCCYSAIGPQGTQEGVDEENSRLQGSLLTAYPLPVDSDLDQEREQLRLQENMKITEGYAKKTKQLMQLLMQEHLVNHPANGGSDRARLSGVEKSHLTYGLNKKEVKPGKKVRSKNGVPGVIIKPAKDEDGKYIRVPGQVRVKYFWQDASGRAGETVAMTKLENLWGEGGAVV